MKQQALQTAGQSALSVRPSSGPLLQRKCACGQHTIAGSACANCSQKNSTIRRRAAHESKDANMTEAIPEIVHETLRSPGQPLDAATRAFMESRFAHDFSHVRVHTDAKAGESARAVGARAYTVGRDVVLGNGRPRTESREGRHLLAHELVHTLQQGGALGALPTNSLRISAPNDAHEREAETIAARVAAQDVETTQAGDGARSASAVTLARTPSLQRQLDETTTAGETSDTGSTETGEGAAEQSVTHEAGEGAAEKQGVAPACAGVVAVDGTISNYIQPRFNTTRQCSRVHVQLAAQWVPPEGMSSCESGGSTYSISIDGIRRTVRRMPVGETPHCGGRGPVTGTADYTLAPGAHFLRVPVGYVNPPNTGVSIRLNVTGYIRVRP